MKKLKAFVAVLLSVILVPTCLPVIESVPVNAATYSSIPISSTNFPDKNFRNYIKGACDDNMDGILDKGEIEEINWLYCDERDISSLKGIEFFPNLYGIDCYFNDIKSVDLSKNTKLKYIDLSDNYISSINLSNNTKLEFVDLSENCISTINLNNNTNLVYLNLADNPITSIDISNCPNLKNLYLNSKPHRHIDYDGPTMCYWVQNENEHEFLIPAGTNIILDGTGNATIVKQPLDFTCEHDEMAVFDVGATGKGLKYQWQYKNAGSSSWTTWSSKTSSVISVAYDESRDGMSVRCIVTDANGNKVTSKTATLKYEYPFYILYERYGTISGQSYVTIPANEAVNFEIGAAGKGLKYLWQYKAKGDDTWTDWTSKTTPIISVAYAPYRDGMSFRCKVTNFEGRVLFSREVELRYETPFAITKQPTNSTVDPGGTAKFSVTATGKDLKYLWQYKEAGKSNWVDWTSKTTASISVAYAAYRDGMSLRCVVTDETGAKLTSDVVKLNYNSVFSITAQPVSATVDVNNLAYFEVKAEGKGLKYLWQYKEAGKSSWTDWTSKTTSKISVAYAASRDGMSLRCIVTDSSGNKLTSNTVTLNYNNPLAITGQPVSIAVNENSLANFEVKATGKGLKYLWQYKEKGKSTWTNWTSKTTAKISVAYAAYRDGMSFRCVVTDSLGNKLTSKAAALTYNKVFAITSQPLSVTVDQNSAANFEIKAEGKGLKYLWQYKLAGDSSWTDWTSKTTARISVAYAAYRNNMQLRCIVTDSNGRTLTSNVVTLKYNAS
ncbi:MAG: hypothetical protein K6E47_00195 [Lachnospiraceae bacterium]|nr:hypothetical protein [Lachnospiraceae bacterium]